MIRESYASVAIRWKDKICLIEQNSGYHAGKLNIVGGKIEPEERQEAAAVREVREETGLTIDPLLLKYEGRMSSHINDHVPDIIYLYSITLDAGNEQALQASAEGKVSWYDFSFVCDPYARNRIVPDLPFVLQNMYCNRVCYYDLMYSAEYGLERLKMELQF